MTSSKQSLKRRARRERQQARCRKVAERCLNRLPELSSNCSHNAFREWITSVTNDLHYARTNIPSIARELRALVTKQPGYQHLAWQKKSKKQPTRRPKIINILQQQLRDFAEKILLHPIDHDTTTLQGKIANVF